jgi:transaldolase
MKRSHPRIQRVAEGRQTGAASPLGRTIAETPTDIWNDSCAIDELEYAIGFGAVGATANPTIVVDVWRKDPQGWAARARELSVTNASWTDVQLAWAIVEDMSLRGARLLEPTFRAGDGRTGRLSIQIDPTLWRTPGRMLEHGLHLHGLAPNLLVKFPTTTRGIETIEEATFRGVSVNCTVSFTVAQALAAADAIERGLRRREAAGLRIDDMGPVVTLMVGRLEDWLRLQAERDGIVADPAILPWSGVAVFKRTYRLFQDRDYRARLLGAAIRHQYHWSELIGGDVAITMPHVWARRFNASDVPVVPRMEVPVEPVIVEALGHHFPDFKRAYDADGLSVDDFDAFPPTVRTLRAFISSYRDLLDLVTGGVLPDPDRRPA